MAAQTEDPLKIMKKGNAVTLYNALQSKYYKLFVDIRCTDNYQKNRFIVPSLHIPLELYKDSSNYPSNEYIENLVKEFKAKQKKNYIISAVYFFSDQDMTNNENKNALLRIRDSLIELNVCRQSNAFVIITDSVNAFAESFPFMMTKNQKTIKKEKSSKMIMKGINLEIGDYGYPNLIIEDVMFLGNSYHATSRQIMTDLQITHIVNCSPIEQIPCQFRHDSDLKIEYLRVPVNDDYGVDIKKYFDAASKFIHDALNAKESVEQKEEVRNRVLVHCQAGISRSASITISYLMKYKKMRYQDAFKYVADRRPVISPNKDFVKQLKQYENELFGAKMVRGNVKKAAALQLPFKVKKNINVRPPVDF